MHKPAEEMTKSVPSVPDKLFYKIGEVSKITGVETYVLRYWETEFSFLRPRKNKSGQRVYIKKDVELIIQIKRMLYQERYTIEGVRKRFGEGILKMNESKPSDGRPRGSQNPSAIIGLVRKRITDILQSIR